MTITKKQIYVFAIATSIFMNAPTKVAALNSNSFTIENSVKVEPLIAMAQKATNEETPRTEGLELLETMRDSIETLTPRERLHAIDQLILQIPWLQSDAVARAATEEDKGTIFAALVVLALLVTLTNNGKVVRPSAIGVGVTSVAVAIYFQLRAQSIRETSVTTLLQMRTALLEIRKAAELELKTKTLSK